MYFSLHILHHVSLFVLFSCILGSILDLSSDSRVTAGPYSMLHDFIEFAPEYKSILTYTLAIRLCRLCQTALGFRRHGALTAPIYY